MAIKTIEKDGKVYFKMYCENGIEEYRYDSFWFKECETLSWLESFKDGEAFFDIGANIGIYSLYCASLYPNSQIYAFEPMPKNFIRLLQNVELNGFKNVHCFNVAFDEKHYPCPRFEKIYVPRDEVGQSGTQINSPVDEQGDKFQSQTEYLIQHLSFLNFMEDFDMGDYHVKIDVDGHEKEIVEGMYWELENIRMKSFLIECNDGGTLKEDVEWVYQYTTDNDFNNHPNHSRIRRKKEGIKAENVIFTRS